jgi:hypothetical protein
MHLTANDIASNVPTKTKFSSTYLVLFRLVVTGKLVKHSSIYLSLSVKPLFDQLSGLRHLKARSFVLRFDT